MVALMITNDSVEFARVFLLVSIGGHPVLRVGVDRNSSFNAPLIGFHDVLQGAGFPLGKGFQAAIVW